MIECFNSIWIILISILLFFIIINKIYNLFVNNTENKKFKKHKNNKYNMTPKILPKLTSYWLGLAT